MVCTKIDDMHDIEGQKVNGEQCVGKFLDDSGAFGETMA